MTKLFLIRHGQTEWNIEKRYQGKFGDSPLLPKSYNDMESVADFLNQQGRFAAGYSSPIKRALVTAETIAAHLEPTPPLTPVDGFMEYDLGDWEGRTTTEVAENWPEEVTLFRNRIEDFDGSAIKGETIKMAQERFKKSVNEIVQQTAQDDHVFIVAHGLILMLGVWALLDIPEAHLRDRGTLSNTSTTILETNDQGKTFQLLEWNKTDYLDDPPAPSAVL